MAKQFVADIKDRDPVVAVFLVKEKIMAMAKNGKPYMNLRLMDKSGEVDAKIWDNVDALDKLFERDDFVQVRGKASVYLNRMQVVVAEITRIAARMTVAGRSTRPGLGQRGIHDGSGLF